MVCKRVQYSGTVQGVGFRYTAQALAASYQVAGWVRNQPDGRVELMAEGAADQVDAFLGAIARRMAGYIDNTVVTQETPSGASGFRIRHYS
jgi:acylphosphatase